MAQFTLTFSTDKIAEVANRIRNKVTKAKEEITSTAREVANKEVTLAQIGLMIASHTRKVSGLKNIKERVINKLADSYDRKREEEMADNFINTLENL